MLLYTLPPLPGSLDRRIGHVLNFFTYPPFRRRGFGQRLLEFIKADATGRKIVRLFLNAAPMGEPLYRKAGFVEQHEKALVLELP
jgi:GNAT superfamily N-acetyltransferase